MKNSVIKKCQILLTAIFLTLSLSSFVSETNRATVKNDTLEIPARTEFRIGEEDDEEFRVTMTNTSNHYIEFLAVDFYTNEMQRGYSIAPGTKFSRKFKKGEICVIQNLHKTDVELSIKTNASMSYEVFDSANHYEF